MRIDNYLFIPLRKAQGEKAPRRFRIVPVFQTRALRLIVPWLMLLAVGIIVTLYSARHFSHSDSGGGTSAFDAIFANDALTLCSTPCLLGIRPGMGYSESRRALLQHPLMRQARIAAPFDTVTTLESTNGLVVTLATPPTRTVGFIQLAWPEPGSRENAAQPPRLGDLLFRLGAPDSVAVEQVGCFGYTILHFGNLGVVMDFSHALDPAAPIDALYLTTMPLYKGLQRFQWQGFSYTWRYGAKATC